MRPNLFAAAAACAMFAAPQMAAAQPTLKTLHDFCTPSDCSDGAFPRAGLIGDADGNLYGTAISAGAGGQGTVFELERADTGYTYKLLYAFCVIDTCADGERPNAGLIIDTEGRLYGTTFSGGATLNGTVFRLAPNKTRKKWSYSLLHSFCPDGFPCTDGNAPVGGLTYRGALSGAPYDGKSPLYGATSQGGSGFGNAGAVYEIDSAGKGTPTQKVLYSFCIPQDCGDGQFPAGTPLVDAGGVLLGATTGGGAKGQGTIYSLTIAHGQATQRTLHDFCQQQNCTDGALPVGALTMDAGGTIFGTTQQGGSMNGGNGMGAGTAFSFSPKGQGFKYTLLYTFCGLANCADGIWPNGSLTIAPNGDLLGTTMAGGPNQNAGVVYKIHGRKQSVLYGFCAQQSCSDGESPQGAIVLDAAGDIFGAADTGGAHGEGTIFELTP